ncbi:hypothetical protein SLS60_009501 [Paraconiothyrium brasiliense]|uniref:Uncharacterized protein n=1 Tax=Paraconiothyrium brasiliense TaxID=300254 RepID=A0ABR3QUG4_9PLEO
MFRPSTLYEVLKEAYSGFRVFQFECHLPYLALRWVGPSTTTGAVFGTLNSRKSWFDLSFLDLRHSDPSSKGAYVLCELHSSLVVSGWDESKWAAYGFTNAEFDSEIDALDNEANQTDEQMTEGNIDAEDNETPGERDDDDYDIYATEVAPGCLEDHLASDGKYGVVLQEHPVWDPRLYFLQLTDFRLRTVRKEWSYLICKIVASVKEQVIVPFLKFDAQEANKLTRKANFIAAENRTVAAANNLNAALMVNMNQFMTPVVVVVGYFSIEGEIFGFRKTAKSFLISVAILFVVLYLVNLLIFLLRHHLKAQSVLARILTGQLDQLLLDRGEAGTWSLDGNDFSADERRDSRV